MLFYLFVVKSQFGLVMGSLFKSVHNTADLRVRVNQRLVFLLMSTDFPLSATTPLPPPAGALGGSGNPRGKSVVESEIQAINLPRPLTFNQIFGPSFTVDSLTFSDEKHYIRINISIQSKSKKILGCLCKFHSLFKSEDESF
jgi:hypothetical protein